MPQSVSYMAVPFLGVGFNEEDLIGTIGLRIGHVYENSHAKGIACYVA